jgi:hypothetical protein
MFWSYLAIFLNPFILIVGVSIMLFYACSPRGFFASQSVSDSISTEDDDDDGDDDEGGWPPLDWDAPLDLPPGVYVLPPEPVHA